MPWPARGSITRGRSPGSTRAPGNCSRCREAGSGTRRSKPWHGRTFHEKGNRRPGRRPARRRRVLFPRPGRQRRGTPLPHREGRAGRDRRDGPGDGEHKRRHDGAGGKPGLRDGAADIRRLQLPREKRAGHRADRPPTVRGFPPPGEREHRQRPRRPRAGQCPRHRRGADAGQTVAASFQTPTLFTIAQDLTKMQIDTGVDEADIGKVKADQQATFTVDAYPEQNFAGKVVQVRSSPVVTQNVVTYNVVVQVDNKDLLLKPGMTANVSVHVRDLQDVLKVPNAALRYRPSEEKKPEEKKGAGGQRVFLLGKDDKPKEVSVKGGGSEGNHTQLVPGDRKEGDPLGIEAGRKKQGAAGGRAPGMRFF